ncbi:helix-turn-helix domain-containing protein [Marinomonas mediterranea]|uniref:helix-turn-helix domain-containing protein n=1 Tax=Marinomonas mediterranea TaxID=119864 RepID=UPI0009FE6A4A|nr:helix-turn-helix domain-containing protein [Marinomonas mediterranea MMB-1]
MTPKAFCRIIRFQSALFTINDSSHTRFSDLAYMLGFSDQPHLLREFKSLLSTTPCQYQSHVSQDDYQRRIRNVS